MKTKIFAAFVLLVFTTLFSLRCSKGGGGDVVFIPDIGQQWVSESNEENIFSFNPSNDGSNTSTFDGTETLLNTGEIFHFTGSYTNHNIQFTYDNTLDPKSGTYNGTINDGSTVMTLNSTTLDDLVLRKQ